MLFIVFLAIFKFSYSSIAVFDKAKAYKDSTFLKRNMKFLEEKVKRLDYEFKEEFERLEQDRKRIFADKELVDEKEKDSFLNQLQDVNSELSGRRREINAMALAMEEQSMSLVRDAVKELYQSRSVVLSDGFLQGVEDLTGKVVEFLDKGKKYPQSPKKDKFRIGYIDSEKIYKKSKRLHTEMEALNESSKDLKKRQEEFKSADEARRKELELELRKLSEDFEAEFKSTSERLNKIVSDASYVLACDEGFDLITERAKVVNGCEDITEKLLSIIDSEEETQERKRGKVQVGSFSLERALENDEEFMSKKREIEERKVKLFQETESKMSSLKEGDGEGQQQDITEEFMKGLEKLETEIRDYYKKYEERVKEKARKIAREMGLETIVIRDGSIYYAGEDITEKIF